MIKLITAFIAILAALIFYAQTQVCNYNSTLSFQEQALKDIQKEIGSEGSMTVKFNKQLDCIEVQDKLADENNIYNHMQKLMKVTIAVINKDKLEANPNAQSVSIEGKSDQETLNILKKIYKDLISKKNQILNSNSDSKDEDVKDLMKAYEELLSKEVVAN